MELVADDEQQRQIQRRRHRTRRGRRETRMVRSSTTTAAAAAAPGAVQLGQVHAAAAAVVPSDYRILQALEPLSWLRRSERALLAHFVQDAYSPVVCSPHGRRASLNLLVPLALQSPSLLYATLAYSASQQASQGVASAMPAIPKYIGLSLASFQTELPRSDRGSNTSLLAASLMLLLVNVSSTTLDDSNSWRVHAEGANALLTSIRQHESKAPTRLSVELEDILRLLSRWFLNVESLASLTATGLSRSQALLQDANSGVIITDPDEATMNVCDDNFGYPTGLAVLLRDIGFSACERRRQFSVSDPPIVVGSALPTPRLTQLDFDLEADRLQMKLVQIANDTLHAPNGLSFYPGVREELSDEDLRGFEACVQAFLCMASILIERRVRGTPTAAPIIQASVRAIITAVTSIPTSSGSSAAMAIAPPLFIAGCESIKEEDRRDVRAAFHAFIEKVKFQSVERALDILEGIWKTDGPVPQDWWTYIENRNWDFLPY